MYHFIKTSAFLAAGFIGYTLARSPEVPAYAGIINIALGFTTVYFFFEWLEQRRLNHLFLLQVNDSLDRMLANLKEE